MVNEGRRNGHKWVWTILINATQPITALLDRLRRIVWVELCSHFIQPFKLRNRLFLLSSFKTARKYAPLGCRYWNTTGLYNLRFVPRRHTYSPSPVPRRLSSIHVGLVRGIPAPFLLELDMGLLSLELLSHYSVFHIWSAQRVVQRFPTWVTYNPRGTFIVQPNQIKFWTYKQSLPLQF